MGLLFLFLLITNVAIIHRAMFNPQKGDDYKILWLTIPAFIIVYMIGL